MPMIPEAVIAMLACAQELVPFIQSFLVVLLQMSLLAELTILRQKLFYLLLVVMNQEKQLNINHLLKKAIELAKHKVEKCIIYQRKDFKVDLDKNEMDWNEFAIKDAKPV